SGSRVSTSSIAWRPLPAAPTISSSGSLANAVVTKRRTTAESSTTSTLITPNHRHPRRTAEPCRGGHSAVLLRRTTRAPMVGCVSISRGSFAFVADLSRRETAMVYETGKEYLVEARLLPLAREAGCADVDAYVARLRSDRSEQARALDALTINETSWFRDRAPFDAFVEVMLPDLLRRRSASRTLRI